LTRDTGRYTEAGPESVGEWLLGECGGEGLMQRYGQLVGARFFNGEGPGDGVGFYAAEDLDGQYWPSLKSAVASCDPPMEFAGGSVITTTVTPTTGPSVGDEAVWYERSTEFSSDPGERDPATAVLVRSGDYVIQISGGLTATKEEIAEFARSALPQD
jgi:hypothetical protein